MDDDRPIFDFTDADPMLGGYQAWISFPLEAVEILGLAGGPFSPRSDFNPDTERSLGEIRAQIRTRTGGP